MAAKCKAHSLYCFCDNTDLVNKYKQYSGESIAIIILTNLVNEPFELNRFATDHSLTKPALLPLFVRVRRCAPQRAFKISYSESVHLFTYNNFWKLVSIQIISVLLQVEHVQVEHVQMLTHLAVN